MKILNFRELIFLLQIVFFLVSDVPHTYEKGKTNLRQMKKKRIGGFILSIVITFSFVQCDGGNSEKDETIIVKKIEVNPGMDLVGMITEAETGNPISNIAVSDGFQTTLTDSNGVFQLKKNENAVFVYYSVPAEYKVDINGNTPAFYEKIDKNDSIFRKDFVLTKLPEGVETNFAFFCMADLHDDYSVNRLDEEFAPDIRQEIKKYDVAYGVCLGDIVSDLMNLLPTMKKFMGNLGLSIFQTIGNHDHNKSFTDDLIADRDFENTFGPTNYSFNRGKVHFVIMDDILYAGRSAYSIGFTEEQLLWLENDLKYVSKDNMLIVCVHVPTRNEEGVVNCQAFYDLIEPFAEVHIMSGHSHVQQNMKLREGAIYEHVIGAASGALWSNNSTINHDGAPNGYAVFNISGNHIRNWYYKGTALEQNYQIRMYPVGSFSDTSSNIVANVWNADEDWKVELYEDGMKSGEMIPFTDYDKAVYQFLVQVLKRTPPTPADVNYTSFKMTNHLYKYDPKSNASIIEIKATDPFGNVYTQNHFTTDFSEFIYQK